MIIFRKLKEIWDYKHYVDYSIDLWKKTLWKKLDIEAMDLACKTLAKEIRGIDKMVREWNLFKGLELTFKNMMTSF